MPRSNRLLANSSNRPPRTNSPSQSSRDFHWAVPSPTDETVAEYARDDQSEEGYYSQNLSLTQHCAASPIATRCPSPSGGPRYSIQDLFAFSAPPIISLAGYPPQLDEADLVTSDEVNLRSSPPSSEAKHQRTASPRLLLPKFDAGIKPVTKEKSHASSEREHILPHRPIPQRPLLDPLTNRGNGKNYRLNVR